MRFLAAGFCVPVVPESGILVGMYEIHEEVLCPEGIYPHGDTGYPVCNSCKEYEDALMNKLQEEVAELLEAYTAKERSALDCAEEMADVMEVLYAMGKTCAVSKREVEQVRSQKAAEKGTFSKKIFLVSTEK